MASFRKRGRVWHYRYVDADGKQRERKGCSDRRETERMALAVELDVANTRSGLVDPKEIVSLRAARRPLAEHLADFRAFLTSKGNTRKHVELSVGRAELIVFLCGARRIVDLTPAAVQGAVASLRAGGAKDPDGKPLKPRSLETCNHHLRAVRAFTRWLWRNGRVREDWLAGLSGFNAQEDRRHDRRTIGLTELRRLIQVTHDGPPYRRMSGPERALCYRIAVATGLRFSEIGSIRPESIDLEGDRPTVTILAGYAKNGQTAVIPLPPELVGDIRAFLAGRPAKRPIFDLPDRGAKMLRADLARADIPYRDTKGLVFDFHSLRCQCATLADQAGVTPRVVQRLMRHSTLELTGRYTRPRPVDLERAVASLPGLAPADGGSDGCDQPTSNSFALPLPYSEHGDGRSGAVTDVGEESFDSAMIGQNFMVQPGLAAPKWLETVAFANSGGGTRTPDTRIMIPLL